MPIYAYRCEACGFAKDALQKVSDAPLTDCPSCGKSTFKKQLTAAGFQLKGTGWYATDFRGGNGAAAPAATPTETAGAPATASTASTAPDAAGSGGASASPGSSSAPAVT
jgi:putative FmdB family regulatory protein